MMPVCDFFARGWSEQNVNIISRGRAYATVLSVYYATVYATANRSVKMTSYKALVVSRRGITGGVGKLCF